MTDARAKELADELDVIVTNWRYSNELIGIRIRNDWGNIRARLLSQQKEVEQLKVELVRLKTERDQWDRRVAYDELKAREYENRATQQAQINAQAATIGGLVKALEQISALATIECKGMAEIADKALAAAKGAQTK